MSQEPVIWTQICKISVVFICITATLFSHMCFLALTAPSQFLLGLPMNPAMNSLSSRKQRVNGWFLHWKKASTGIGIRGLALVLLVMMAKWNLHFQKPYSYKNQHGGNNTGRRLYLHMASGYSKGTWLAVGFMRKLGSWSIALIWNNCSYVLLCPRAIPIILQHANYLAFLLVKLIILCYYFSTYSFDIFIELPWPSIFHESNQCGIAFWPLRSLLRMFYKRRPSNVDPWDVLLNTTSHFNNLPLNLEPLN